MGGTEICAGAWFRVDGTVFCAAPVERSRAWHEYLCSVSVDDERFPASDEVEVDCFDHFEVIQISWCILEAVVDPSSRLIEGLVLEDNLWLPVEAWTPTPSSATTDLVGLGASGSPRGTMDVEAPHLGSASWINLRASASSSL